MAKFEEYSNYFEFRGVDPTTYLNYTLPTYLQKELPNAKDAPILDLGCGFGQMLHAITRKGYTKLTGIDINDEAVAFCKSIDLSVKKVEDLNSFASENPNKYEIILMSHVLEHIPKGETLSTLKLIFSMLKPGGKFLVMVPNGQAPNHSYWMWEDFTHYTLYTSGSLHYVLSASGFKEITFLDPHDLLDKSGLKRIFKRFFQYLFRFFTNFWNSVNSSGYHFASPVIYTWELKAKAIKPLI